MLWMIIPTAQEWTEARNKVSNFLYAFSSRNHITNQDSLFTNLEGYPDLQPAWIGHPKRFWKVLTSATKILPIRKRIISQNSYYT